MKCPQCRLNSEENNVRGSVLLGLHSINTSCYHNTISELTSLTGVMRHLRQWICFNMEVLNHRTLASLSLGLRYITCFFPSVLIFQFFLGFKLLCIPPEVHFYVVFFGKILSYNYRLSNSSYEQKWRQEGCSKPLLFCQSQEHVLLFGI